MVVKLIKNVAKHDAAALLPGGGGGGGSGGVDGVGEVVKLLLGVARLVSRMPDQRKLLKVGQGHPGRANGARADRGGCAAGVLVWAVAGHNAMEGSSRPAVPPSH